MSRILPSNPNFEHLRKEAKALLRAARDGDDAALERFRAIGAFSPTNPPALADAQHLLARQYGFDSWSSLKTHVDANSRPVDPMEALAAAIVADDAGAVSAALARHPSLRGRLGEPVPGGSFGAIPITMATSQRNIAMIDALLAAGADLDARTQWWAGGFSALDVADTAFAPLLLERGATLTAVAAARLGMLDELTRLLDEDPRRVAERAGDGQTPLHNAANVEIARLLLDRGADIDALDVDHESTPAMYHVRERTAVSKFLVSRGCKTDILMAAAVGDVDLVRAQLDRDPNAIRTTVSDRYFPKRNPRAGGTIYIWTIGSNKSPHLVAREFGHVDVFALLMERTPDTLALATAAETGDEARLAGKPLAAHPDLASRLSDDETLKIASAAQANDRRAVELMLRAGWTANARPASGATALHWAGFHGNVEMLRDLLAHGARVDAVEAHFSGTPLDWTLHGSEKSWHKRTGDHPAAVRALLAAGAERPSSLVGTAEAQAALTN